MAGRPKKIVGVAKAAASDPLQSKLVFNVSINLTHVSAPITVDGSVTNTSNVITAGAHSTVSGIAASSGRQHANPVPLAEASAAGSPTPLAGSKRKRADVQEPLADLDADSEGASDGESEDTPKAFLSEAESERFRTRLQSVTTNQRQSFTAEAINVFKEIVTACKGNTRIASREIKRLRGISVRHVVLSFVAHTC
jgi:hypothetical protein